MSELVAGAATDAGAVRETNEDAVATWEVGQAYADHNGYLAALADGMGGHQKGEVASAEAIRLLFERFYAGRVSDVQLLLRQCFRHANEMLYSQGAAHGEDRTMGTTLVAAVVRGNLLIVANVGDSRAYIVRGGRAQPVTRDHSVVAEQVAAGAITPAEALTSVHRNVITRALGHQDRVEVDVFDVPLLPKDAIVLASDGLYTVLTDVELARLANAETPQTAATAMVTLARDRRSADNASAVVLHYHAVPPGPRVGGLFDTDQLPVARRRRPMLVIVSSVLILALIVALVVLALTVGLPTI